WQCILQAPCTFPSSLFSDVLLNIIRNPNLTSPLLFRADILYDSETDHLFDADGTWGEENGGAKRGEWEGWKLQRVLVRMLVPRNERRDEGMVQSCWLLRKSDESEDGSGTMEHHLVVLVPHVEAVEEMPFYHPAVEQLAFLHSWRAAPSPPRAPPEQDQCEFEIGDEQPGTLTLLIHRTSQILLSTIHKHATGLLTGYTKRVHHDRLIPQAQYQNTYSRLKSKYGRTISEQWVEVTDPGKHVFEDLGIAAWCIEVWRMLYEWPKGKPPFPGFVDIGCGNGLLAYILLSEGYPGWGFDARERKTWSIFPPEIRAKLQQRVLVPRTLQGEALGDGVQWHNGFFEPGTFIISNHADELTAWTPLLGYLNGSSWMAIPCCSHDLGGKRFRAPARSRGMKMPSAYSTLCSYVSSLSREVGYTPEEDILRIPSTRNTCVLGRANVVNG
ncbi:uncharacterized protein MYCGRDRAFT_29864, partial [Zymoseptoria tritici IPO323]